MIHIWSAIQAFVKDGCNTLGDLSRIVEYHLFLLLPISNITPDSILV